MRAPYTQLYLHAVWSTWQRLPMITPALQPQIYACMQRQCRLLRADVLAIGGMPDHVHLLVRFPTTLAVAELVRRAKGASSHLVTHVVGHPEPFRWQGGYGAFTVSKRGTGLVREYVLNQERHHHEGTLWEALERTEE
jgi:putative transposase